MAEKEPWPQEREQVIAWFVALGHTPEDAAELWHVGTMPASDREAYLAKWEGRTDTHDTGATCALPSTRQCIEVGWRGVPSNPKNHGVSAGGRRFLATDDPRAPLVMAREDREFRSETRREWSALGKAERRKVRAVARATGHKVRSDLK